MTLGCQPLDGNHRDGGRSREALHGAVGGGAACSPAARRASRAPAHRSREGVERRPPESDFLQNERLTVDAVARLLLRVYPDTPFLCMGSHTACDRVSKNCKYKIYWVSHMFFQCFPSVWIAISVFTHSSLTPGAHHRHLRDIYPRGVLLLTRRDRCCNDCSPLAVRCYAEFARSSRRRHHRVAAAWMARVLIEGRAWSSCTLF